MREKLKIVLSTSWTVETACGGFLSEKLGNFKINPVMLAP